MSLEALNESNLKAVQRFAEKEIERLRDRLEAAASNGDTVTITHVAGGIQQMRYTVAECERFIQLANGKGLYDGSRHVVSTGKRSA